MKEEQKEAFFNQVEEVLQAHEDQYEPGAWEEFVVMREKKKRKSPIYWWTAAAAILLIGSITLFEISSNENQKKHPLLVAEHNAASKGQVKSSEAENTGIQKSAVENRAVGSNDVGVSGVENNEVAKSEVEKSVVNKILGQRSVVEKINAQRSEVETVTQIIEVQTATATVPAQNNNLAVTTKDTELKGSAVKPFNNYAQTPVSATAYDSLVNRNSKALPIIQKNESKLSYALVVAPSVGNQKMNFGAGMELSYQIGGGLSLNTGLNYTALNAKSEGKAMSNARSQGQIANLALTGIELPLGIQYKTKDGFYATAGISALGLINDKLEYSYLTDKAVSMMVETGGVPREEIRLTTETKTEKSIEPLANYMGFFNFSAGKKQAFGKVNLNIGPFVKVPFSSVSQERIKLLQGGVKISFDF